MWSTRRRNWGQSLAYVVVCVRGDWASLSQTIRCPVSITSEEVALQKSVGVGMNDNSKGAVEIYVRSLIQCQPTIFTWFQVRQRTIRHPSPPLCLTVVAAVCRLAFSYPCNVVSTTIRMLPGARISRRAAVPTTLAPAATERHYY